MRPRWAGRSIMALAMAPAPALGRKRESGGTVERLGNQQMRFLGGVALSIYMRRIHEEAAADHRWRTHVEGLFVHSRGRSHIPQEAMLSNRS